MRYPNRTDNTAVERLLTDIHRVLIRMEERLNVIEKSVKKEKTKKQILKGNE
jgi:methyl coenzyme M reductase alpha subunit